MTTLISVALGGAIGAVMRYLVGLAVAFPFGTLAVNAAGSLAIGVLFVALSAARADWSAFLMIGVLGGFTTFSSFSLDTIKLVLDGRIGFAGGYVMASVGLSLIACWLGIIAATKAGL